MARALTKRRRTGMLYTRPPEIEAKIDRALAQDLATLHRRALVQTLGLWTTSNRSAWSICSGMHEVVTTTVRPLTLCSQFSWGAARRIFE